MLILVNSKLIKRLLSFYNKWKYNLLNYPRIKAVIRLTEKPEKKLYFARIKTIGVIAITAILTNIFFSILLKKEIGPIGWIIRLLFLFVGLAGLFCNAG